MKLLALNGWPNNGYGLTVLPVAWTPWFTHGKASRICSPSVPSAYVKKSAFSYKQLTGDIFFINYLFLYFYLLFYSVLF